MALAKRDGEEFRNLAIFNMTIEAKAGLNKKYSEYSKSVLENESKSIINF